MELFFSGRQFFFSGKASELKSYMEEAVRQHTTLKDFLKYNLN